MLDAVLRPLYAPLLDRAAQRLVRAGIGADAVTWTGFAVGLAAVPLLAAELYWPALAAFLLNRLLDGLDGAVARRRGATDLGGFLDISLDFIVYAGVPLGFALARPEANGLAAAFLLFSFMGTGATFLAFATVAAKRGLSSERHGPKAIYYLGGLTEGTETTAAFALACLFPGAFPAIAVLFGGLCCVTAGSRIAAGRAALRDASSRSAGPGS